MKTRSRLLKILRTAEDILIFFDDYFKSTRWVYQSTGFSKPQLRKSKSYLKRKNKIDGNFRIKDDNRSVLSLVTAPWDKKWRMVCFDIPEENRSDRDQLSYQLEKLGFKHFQRSVWISPLSVNKYLKKITKRINDQNYLSIFIGSLYNQDPKKLVKDLWRLDWWQEAAKKLLDDMEGNKVTKKSKERFWNLILNHPKVPLDLLPQKWPLEKLTVAFREKVKIKPSS